MSSSVSTASSFNMSDLDMEIPRQALSQLDLSQTSTVPMSFVQNAGDASTAAQKQLPSFYHVNEMNKEPVPVATPRLARVPSQYLLESLTEVYVFDIPCLASSSAVPTLRNTDEDDISAETALEFSVPLPQLLPRFLPSEYVSEMLL